MFIYFFKNAGYLRMNETSNFSPKKASLIWCLLSFYHVTTLFKGVK